MTLTIIIPVFNEKNTIEKVLDKIISLSLKKEIFVIDDGSTDGTKELLYKISKLAKYSKVKFFFHEKNKGKGSAIRTALKYVQTDFVCIQDADLEYNPDEIIKMFYSIINNNADVVFGSRFLKDNPVIYKKYYLGNKFITFLINLFYGSKFTDTYTCYKMLKTSLLKKFDLESKRFEIEAEICIKVAKTGAKYLEIPICYSPRTIINGKKIKLIDAIKGLITILKFRF